MSHDELDLFVMGQIMAHCYQLTTLQGHHSSSTSPEQRKTTYGQFYHQGQRVCHCTFLFLHNIGFKRFYLMNGPAVRVHGKTGKRPKHHLTLQPIKDIVQFILNYTSKISVCTCTHMLTYMLYLSIQQRLMQWSSLAEFLGIRGLTSSSSPAALPNTLCGICTSKRQQ